MKLIQSVFFSSISFLFVMSCTSNSDETEASPDVEVRDTVRDVVTAGSDTAIMVKSSPLLWYADFEEASNTYKIKKPAQGKLDTVAGERIITLINNDWDSIQLDYVKKSHDTVFVSIPNSEYLTQKIGSSGAENFMATTTFSLTEMKGIKYVNFKFKAGDHATPGVYSRSDFKAME